MSSHYHEWKLITYGHLHSPKFNVSVHENHVNLGLDANFFIEIIFQFSASLPKATAAAAASAAPQR